LKGPYLEEETDKQFAIQFIENKCGITVNSNVEWGVCCICQRFDILMVAAN